jgi:hypothetical protein
MIQAREAADSTCCKAAGSFADYVSIFTIRPGVRRAFHPRLYAADRFAAFFDILPICLRDILTTT